MAKGETEAEAGSFASVPHEIGGKVRGGSLGSGLACSTLPAPPESLLGLLFQPQQTRASRSAAFMKWGICHYPQRPRIVALWEELSIKEISWAKKQTKQILACGWVGMPHVLDQIHMS